MVSSLSAACLCAAIFLAMCSAASRPCPAPCACSDVAVACQGCPTDYLTVADDTEHLYIRGCRDIEYLLRLRRHREEGGISDRFSIRKLEIRDSLIDAVPETYLNDDYSIQTLILTNNSIHKIDSVLKVSNLTYLDLSRNNLSHIGNGIFRSMNYLQYLDMSVNGINELSAECFSGLGELLNLDISVNNLTHLGDGIFLPLSSLQRLNLSSNRLEALSERSFSSLLPLQQLDVSYNRLTSVAPGALQFLPNLARLLLADNPQLRPDAQIFVGTGRRLRQVDASRTGLSQVPEALTHSVRYLTLAGNRIATVRCGDLDSYPLLRMLDFANNIIGDIEDDALGRLEMLTQLYLNRNALRTPPRMLPDKLTYLSLDSNLIGNLTTVDFATLSALNTLILSNNLISYIQENVFIQLTSLEVLDLSNNPLKALTPNTFSGPISLKDLRIAFVDISPPARDISFPVPYPEGIENLHLEFSPGLARELMADTAALAAMTRLQHLDMRYSNITNIRSDLLHFLPQLKVLKLEGNKLNCSDLNWLSEWMRENLTNDYSQVKCFTPPALSGHLVLSLPRLKNKSDSRDSFILPRNETKIINSSVVIKIENPAINFIEIKGNDKPDIPSVIMKSKSNNLLYSGKQTTFESIDTNDDNLTENQNVNNISDIFSVIKNSSDDRKIYSDQKHSKKENMYNNTKNIGDIIEAHTHINSRILKDIESFNNIGASESNAEPIEIEKPIVNSREKLEKTGIQINTPAIKYAGRSKLIEIFSEMSRAPISIQNETSEKQKMNTTTQESVSLCSSSGNSNGTENKTKCSQHPAIAPMPSETRENKNTKPERFMYRKIGDDKSNANVKSKKINSEPLRDISNSTVLYDSNYRIETLIANVTNHTTKGISETALTQSRDSQSKPKGVAAQETHSYVKEVLYALPLTTETQKTVNKAIEMDDTQTEIKARMENASANILYEGKHKEDIPRKTQKRVNNKKSGLDDSRSVFKIVTETGPTSIKEHFQAKTFPNKERKTVNKEKGFVDSKSEIKMRMENENSSAVSEANKSKAHVLDRVSDSFYSGNFEERPGENASEYQTSRFRAEGNSGPSLGALLAVGGAACAAMAGACLVRRRPRPSPHSGTPDMMEVPTISAVGELW